MYKIVKDPGTTSNVFLQNTDTMAEVNLGRISPTICRILEKEGYSCGEMFEGKVTPPEVKWNLTISEVAKDAFRKLAIPMKKPVRQQQTEPKKTVNLMDMIFFNN